MVRMRDAAAIAIVAMMILSAVPFVLSDEGSSAGGTAVNGVLIYEIQPKSTNDGFALKNYSSSTINLEGYYITESGNSPKKFIFGDISIAAGHVAAFVKVSKNTDDFSTATSTRSVTVAADNKVTLNNSGDTLYLYNPSDVLVDAICYGNGTATAGWTGMPVDMGFKEDVIRRCESTDTNTYFDWVAIGKGYTGFSYDSSTAVDTTVKAFTFPESGGRPVLKALSKATSSIKISIYMITSSYVASILKDRVEDGVNVQVILERNPLGSDQESFAGLMKAIDESPNGEVKYIGGGTYDRYSYVHNKYAIIDGEDVIITSENWTVGNMSATGGNRGWGAVVSSTAFADKMDAFFTNDWGFDDDFKSFSELYSAVAAADLPDISTVSSYYNEADGSQTFSGVSTKIYMSPDNTFKALQDLITNADDRVYTEQMDVGATYENLSNTSPLSAFRDAANRGVDARFMLSSSKENDAFVNTLNTTTNIKSSSMGTSGYATMHNKGVIIDDSVWLSSVNWTSNAFMNNRECGLFMDSADVAEYYLDAYMVDWNKNYKLTDILTIVPNLSAGSFSVKDASGTYTWTAFNTDGDSIKTFEGSVFDVGSLDGVGLITVKDSKNKTGRFLLSGTAPEPTPDSGNTGSSNGNIDGKQVATYGGIAAAILIVLLIVWKLFVKDVKKSAKKTVKKTVKRSTKGSSKKR